MASETFYVDELLKAQEQGNKIIKAAQKQRQRKLREAKLSADQEIERFRHKKEEQFKNLQERKEDKQFELDLKSKTDQEIDQIRADFNRNKDRVVQMLVQNVLNVDLEIPVSIREKFTKKE